MNTIADIEAFLNNDPHWTLTHSGIEFRNCGYFAVYSLPTEAQYERFLEDFKQEYTDDPVYWDGTPTEQHGADFFVDWLSQFRVGSWG